MCMDKSGIRIKDLGTCNRQRVVCEVMNRESGTDKECTVGYG